MYQILGFFGGICCIMTLVSLIKPKWGTLGKRPDWKRKKIATIWFVLAIIFSLGANVTTPESVKIEQQQKAEQQKMEQAKKEYAKDNPFCKNYGMSVESAKAIDAALQSIGISSVRDVTKQQDFYTLKVEEKDGYTPADDAIHLFLDKDNNVSAIKLNAISLYENGKAIHQVSEYILKPSEQADMKTQAEAMVKKVLKAPTTAKFDSGTYRFFKQDGVATLIGTVDAQNSFGAMIRSNFKVQFDCNNNMRPLHMSFEGKDLF